MKSFVVQVQHSLHSRKAVKGSIIADHLANNAIEEYEPLSFDFPNKDVLIIEK